MFLRWSGWTPSPCRKRLAKALGVPSLAPADVQYSLNSLKAKTIISKAPGGVHTFESAAFERWVRTLAPANA